MKGNPFLYLFLFMSTITGRESSIVVLLQIISTRRRYLFQIGKSNPKLHRLLFVEWEHFFSYTVQTYE